MCSRSSRRGNSNINPDFTLENPICVLYSFSFVDFVKSPFPYFVYHRGIKTIDVSSARAGCFCSDPSVKRSTARASAVQSSFLVMRARARTHPRCPSLKGGTRKRKEPKISHNKLASRRASPFLNGARSFYIQKTSYFCGIK